MVEGSTGLRRLLLGAMTGACVTGLAATGVQAADLGGDCCADLEERVAELEATTVRKGNRKVSLQLSGHVNQAVVWFDNGEDSDVYVLDNGNSMTRVRLRGSANFKPGWSAGFYIELGIRDDDSYAVGPDPDTNSGGAGNGDDSASILIRQANWYLGSPLGRVTVGQGSTATDGISEIDLSGTFAVSYSAGDGPLTSNNFANVGIFQVDGPRLNVVRYDTPTLAGFTLSASWGEDDYWDAALRYAGEFQGLRIAIGAGYQESNDDITHEILGAGFSSGNFNSGWSISGSLWHVPTGLFVTAAYSDALDFDRAGTGVPAVDAALIAGLEDQDAWYVKAGIRRRFFALGQTSIYGEYGESTNVLDIDRTAVGVDLALVDTEYYGVGLVQNIDAAAMELYVGWRRLESNAPAASGSNELDVVTMGGRIKF